MPPKQTPCSLVKVSFGFVSGSSTHQNRIDCIKKVFHESGKILDPHTADGVNVAHAYIQPNEPMIVLETALPIKFAETIIEAIGQSPEMPDNFKELKEMKLKYQVLPRDVNSVKNFIHDKCS